MPTGPTRRDFLSSLPKVGLVTGTMGVTSAGYRLSTLPMDIRNLDMPASVIERLARSALVDWQYCWDSALDVVPEVPQLFGKADQMQEISAEAGFVSTPDDGIAAGLTKTGRMSTLLVPATGFTHQLPYYAHDPTEPLLGAKPHAGGFGGLHLDGRTTWLWHPEVEHGIDYVERSGLLRLRYELPATVAGESASAGTAREDGRVVVEERLYVVPGTETIAREFTVHNETGVTLDGGFTYHMQANVTDNQQNFVVWQSKPNRLDADETLRWTDLKGPYELLVYADTPVVRAGAARTGPGVTPNSERQSSAAVPGIDDATGTTPASSPDDGLLPVVLASDRTSVEGRYLSGQLTFDLDVPPGARQDLTVFVTGGPDPSRLPDALVSSRRRRRARARTFWSTQVDSLRLSGIPARYHGAATRAAITVTKLVDPGSASISASGNLQPSYYPTWPRDGAFASVALSSVGLVEPAKRYLATYLPRIQEDDGSFLQCYDSRGVDAGLLTIENDQQPIYAWAVRQVYDRTGDEAFFEAAWPAVEAALDYTVDAVAPNGLLAATPDIAEGPTAARQSLWTNAMAYEGLLAGSSLAAVAGTDPTDYQQAARTVGQSLYDRFFDREEFITDIGFWGPGRNLKGYNAVAVWPSRWAHEFGEVGTITSALREQYRERGTAWIPGELLTVGALARAGDTDTADALFDDVVTQTAPSGYLAEETTDDGKHILGSPLGWSSSMLLLALAERYRS